MYKLVKPLLFKLDPERAHGLTINALKCVQNVHPFYLSLISYLLITININATHSRYFF